MSNAIWGNPKPTSDEHYPLKLLKGLLLDVLKQVPAYGACLALYDESINQMVIRLHMRCNESARLEGEPGLNANNGQTHLSQLRNTTKLIEKPSLFSDNLQSSTHTNECFVTVFADRESGLFPVGNSYPLGVDMIGVTWRNNQSYHISQEKYQALRADAQQPFLIEDVMPSWYLTLPLREPEQVYDDSDRRQPQNRTLGVIVLYQMAPLTGFQLQQRQVAQQQAERIGLYLQNDRLMRLQTSTGDHIKHLQQISTTFPNTLRLSDLVEEIYHFITNTVDVSSLLLTLYDRDTKKLYDIFAVDKGQRVEGLTDRPIAVNPSDRPHWSQITQRDKRTLFLSTHKHERAEWQIYEELLTGTWGDQMNAETFLLIPMKMFTRVVGSLCITSQRPNAYNPLEILVLETMVQIITVAIENAKLYERPRLALKLSQRREKTLASTVSGLLAISNVLNANELLQKFVQIVGNLAQAEMCSFFQVMPEGNDLVAQAIFDRTGNWKANDAAEDGNDDHDELIKLIRLPLAGSPLEDMMDEPFFYLDQPQIEAIAQTCCDSGKMFLSETRTQQMLMIPMRYQTKDIIGILAIHTSQQQRIFPPGEVSIIMAISAQAAGAIRNAQLFEQIQEANAELQRMDRVKDEFIVTASHELRTPLSAISGYSSLLKRQGERGRVSAEQVLKYATKMVGSTQQLTDLVENMTQAARMGALDKKLELQLVPSSLLAATETAVNMLNISIEQHITVEILTDLWVYSDEMRLRQVITNLLENASKYSSPQARILIAARSIPLSWLPEHQVDYNIIANGDDPEVVQVRVYDEGEGIASEDAEKIFEKFVRAPRSLTTPVRGTGLGLFICRRFIEAMGGRLWLEQSLPGKGSIFSFYLKRAPQLAAKGEQDEPETEPEAET